MFKKEKLKDILNKPGVTSKNILLIILNVDDCKPKKVREIKELAVSAGKRDARKWNISSILLRSRGLAVLTGDGWELTASGKEHLKSLEIVVDGVIEKVSVKLRDELTSIKSEDIKSFLDEAIRCLESRLYRAAVVLSWVGAMATLYDYVLENRLPEFNKEAIARNKKWKQAKNPDDLALMNEHDFLQILQKLSVIGKSVKIELESCLKLRNGCGHPNSLKIEDHRVASHIEILILNIFSKF